MSATLRYTFTSFSYLPSLNCCLHQAQEQLDEPKLEAVQDNNMELVTEILGDISNLKVKDDSAAELSRILKEPHFQVRWRNQSCDSQEKEKKN